MSDERVVGIEQSFRRGKPPSWLVRRGNGDIVSAGFVTDDAARIWAINHGWLPRSGDTIPQEGAQDG